MTSALSFALIHTSDTPDIWHSCQSLAQVLCAGDDLVLFETGSATDRPLDRFTRETGWPHNIIPKHIRLPDMPAADQRLALAQSQADHPYIVQLTSQDIMRPKGVAELRQAAGAAPDLIVANHGWHLGQGLGQMPTADADRWAGALDAHMLSADPDRLTGPAAGPDYDAALAKAQSIQLVSEPVLLRPLPDHMDLTTIPDITKGVLASGPADRATYLGRALQRLSDGLALLHPDQALTCLGALTQMLNALPRRDRKAAAAQMPLLAALSKGGPDAALPHLMLGFAAQDRSRLQAMTKGVAQLRQDVDTALPGPDYLIELYERTRRG